MQVYCVFVQGWGTDENAYEFCGDVYSTLESAEAYVEVLLQEWKNDGNDRNDVVYKIEQKLLR